MKFSFYQVKFSPLGFLQHFSALNSSSRTAGTWFLIFTLFWISQAHNTLPTKLSSWINKSNLCDRSSETSSSKAGRLYKCFLQGLNHCFPPRLAKINTPPSKPRDGNGQASTCWCLITLCSWARCGFPLFFTPNLPNPRKAVTHLEGRNRNTAEVWSQTINLQGCSIQSWKPVAVLSIFALSISRFEQGL